MLRRNLNPFWLIAIASLLVGAIMLPFGIAQQVHDNQFRAGAKRTESVSIKQVPVSGTRGATLIEFSYIVNGRTYTIRQNGPDFREQLVNQTVLYNPSNPSQAELANADLTNQGMVFGLAVFFLLLGLVLSAVIWLVRAAWRTRHKAS